MAKLLNLVFRSGKRLFDGDNFNRIVDAINTLAGESGTITALNTVGAGTISAAAIYGGIVTRGGSQSGSAFTDTTATAAAIIALLGTATIGESFDFYYVNTTNAPATITGGTGVTVSGNAVVPPNSWTNFLVTYTAANTITIVGFISGRNVLQNTQAVVATADNGTTQTLTAAMVTGGNFTSHLSTGGSTPSLTMPTAAAIIAAIPSWQIGQSYLLRIINANSGTATVVTNTGITTTGTLTLATNTTRDFVITMTGAAAVTMVSVGTGTNS